MAEANYRRMHLLGLIVSDSESMAIMTGSMAAYGQVWHWSSSESYIRSTARGGEKNLVMMWACGLL